MRHCLTTARATSTPTPSEPMPLPGGPARHARQASPRPPRRTRGGGDTRPMGGEEGSRMRAPSAWRSRPSRPRGERLCPWNPYATLVLYVLPVFLPRVPLIPVSPYASLLPPSLYLRLLMPSPAGVLRPYTSLLPSPYTLYGGFGDSWCFSRAPASRPRPDFPAFAS